MIPQSLKEKLFFWEDYYPSEASIYRRRGNETEREDLGAVRMLYDDLPNAHLMENGEETKAVPLSGVTQSFKSNRRLQIIKFGEKRETLADKLRRGTPFIEDPEEPDIEDPQYIVGWAVEDLKEIPSASRGTPSMHFIEWEDGQLVPWKPDFTEEKVEVDQNGETVTIPKVEAAIINNKDERLQFWLDQLKKKAEKYTLPGFIAENRDLVMALATGFSIAAIIYATGMQFGDYIPVIQEFLEYAPSFEETVRGMAPGSPPGN